MSADDKIRLRVPIDGDYIDRADKLLARLKRRNIASYLDLEKLRGDSFTVEFTDDSFTVFSGDTEGTHSYKDIKVYTMYSDGLMLRLRDKRMIFLPVGDTEEYNMELIFLSELLFNKCGDLRFECHSRLSIPDLSDEAKAKNGKVKHHRVNTTIHESPRFLLIFSVITIIIGLVFTSMMREFKPILREDAVSYERIYSDHKTDHDGYIELYFTDGTHYTIHHAASDRDVDDRIESLTAGTRVSILINPDINYIIEVSAGDEMIMDMDTAQSLMYTESKFFFGLGIFCFGSAVFFAVYAVIRIVRERSVTK